MGCREREIVDKMKSLHIINILSPYSFACAPESYAPANMKYPEWTRMHTPEDGIAFVRKMVDWGAHYIKIIIASKILKANPSAPVSKETAEKNLRKFIAAGVPLLVSTDANEDDPCPPASVEYGKGLLDEIMNMQECGLETEEILSRGTSLAAEYFGHTERGVIVPGKIADLLLVDGNPQKNLKDIYNTSGVWFEGNKI